MLLVFVVRVATVAEAKGDKGEGLDPVKLRLSPSNLLLVVPRRCLCCDTIHLRIFVIHNNSTVIHSFTSGLTGVFSWGTCS